MIILTLGTQNLLTPDLRFGSWDDKLSAPIYTFRVTLLSGGDYRDYRSCVHVLYKYLLTKSQI